MRALRKMYNKGLKNKGKLKDYLKDEYIDEDGYGVIDINIYDGFELFDPLSMGRGLELNPDIYEFIDKKTNIIPVDIPLKIRFHAKDLNENDRKKIAALIEEHYTVEKYDIQWDIRSNTRKIISLAGIGIFILALYFLLQTLFENLLFLEVLSIIGTFAIWEAVDFFMLERSDLKKKYLNNLQSLSQTVEFCEK